MTEHPLNPRQIVEQRLKADLGEADPMDIRSAVLCGELGCDEVTQDYISRNPRLRCPYSGRVENASAHCERLRQEYQAAVTKGMDDHTGDSSSPPA